MGCMPQPPPSSAWLVVGHAGLWVKTDVCRSCHNSLQLTAPLVLLQPPTHGTLGGDMCDPNRVNS